MAIRMDARMNGADEVMAQLLGLSRGGAARAYAKALNDVGFEARSAMQKEFSAVFSNVTPYVLKSVRVKMATADRLSVTIEPTYYGGKCIDPQKILQAQEYGGKRRDKRSEVALRRVGILPNGYQTVIPGKPFPGSVDQYGNIKGSFITQLLSYLWAFGEQGYKANMSRKGAEKLHRGSKKAEGRRYFVVYGRMRGEARSGHLAPGIWAASGTHGSNIRPVLMFVRAPSYASRLSMDRIVQKAQLSSYLDRRIRFRFREAAGV